MFYVYMFTLILLSVQENATKKCKCDFSQRYRFRRSDRNGAETTNVVSKVSQYKASISKFYSLKKKICGYGSVKFIWFMNRSKHASWQVA